MSSLWSEFRRRNVVRVGIAYVLMAWVLLQVVDFGLDIIDAPNWVMQLLVLLAVIGLPAVLVFAWVFEMTPEGLKRESEISRDESIPKTGHRLDRAIIILLLLAVGYFAVDKFALRESTPHTAVQSAATGVSEGQNESIAPQLPDDRSIAILPLKTIAQNEPDDAFAAGVHSGLVTELAGISSLRVVSRSSAESLVNRELGTRQIAGLLNVATLLEGEIQRAGDQLRVSLQLVDAATETYLWAETFDRALTADNLFAVQDEIARSVASAMEATLTESEVASLGSMPTRDIEALELYFQGLSYMDRRNETNLETAIELFSRALEKDPVFAQAMAAKAQATLLLVRGNYGSLTQAEVLALARPLVDRAVELAPDDALVLATKGFLLSFEFREDQAVSWFRKSLEVNPANGEVINWLRSSLLKVGDVSEANALLREAVRVDPLSRVALSNAATRLARVANSDPSEIAALISRLEQVDPVWASYTRAIIAMLFGRLVEAVEHYQESLILDPRFTRSRAFLAHLLAQWDLPEAAQALDSAIDEVNMALLTSDWPRAVAVAQAEFEANPQDPATVAHLADALFGSGQFEASMRLGLVAWESTYRNPHSWHAEDLVDMAWLGRRMERPSVEQEFTAATREVLQTWQSYGVTSRDLEITAAKLAMLDGHLPVAVDHLATAIDFGYREIAALDTPQWAPLAEQLGFRAQVNRLERLIAEEQTQVLEILCEPGGLLASHGAFQSVCLPG